MNVKSFGKIQERKVTKIHVSKQLGVSTKIHNRLGKNDIGKDLHRLFCKSVRFLNPNLEGLMMHCACRLYAGDKAEL